MAVSLSSNTRLSAELTLRLAPRLSRWIQTEMTGDQEHDLSMRQLGALQYITGSETTLGDVARSLNVTPAVVTGLIDRLERRGYVRRVASMFDRRRVHIELTTAGEDIRDQAEGQLAKRLDSAISALPEGDIARLEEGLRVLEEIIGTLESQRTNRRGPKTASGS
jgi:DNA-binding MarR family transcriptional regulator